MKTIILKTGVFFIIIGIIALALNLSLGWNTVTYIQATRYNGLIYYKIDAWAYVNNVKNSFTTWPKIFVETPTRQWDNSGIDIGNNMAVMLDWFFFVCNIIIFPLRLAGYIIQCILAIIGLQVVETPDSNPLKWLVDFTKFMTLLQIQYI